MTGLIIIAAILLIIDAVVLYLAIGFALAEFKNIYLPFIKHIF